VNNRVVFVAKVFKAKTRTKNGKDYFTFRINIPKEESEKLLLTEEDYLFLTVMKAKWYHMLNWNEMSTTWKMLPKQLKDEITQTNAIQVEVEGQLPNTVSPTCFRPSPLEGKRVLTNTPYVS
jgi:hypothetical protein